MPDHERIAQLDVYRQALVDNSFLSKVRTIARIAFGERETDTAVALQPPLVEQTRYIGATGEQVAKVYDADNLRIPLLWRVSVGEDYNGKKFFNAHTALENGVMVKGAPRGKSAPRRYSVRPLRDTMRAATERYETGPDATFRLQCDGIFSYQSSVVHPGTLVYALKPKDDTEAFSALLAEQSAAETTLEAASTYVYNRNNPQPVLGIPFMRVTLSEHDEGQRRTFLEQILTRNIFPVQIDLLPVATSLRTT